MNIQDYFCWTAIITPMFDNGDIDYASLTNLLKDQEKANNGILLLGSTGEGMNIDLATRKKIMEFAVDLHLTVPLMGGIGGINMEETQDWVRFLNTLPFQCYLAVTPLYAKPGELGQYAWFKNILDTSSRPVMVYNIPSRAGCALNPAALKRLQDHKNLWALKEASGSVDSFKNYREMAPKVEIYSGDDGMTPLFAAHGCRGVVSVASNVWPKETNLFAKLSVSQKLTQEEIELWDRCADTLFLTSNPTPAKGILKAQGRIKTATLRLPLIASDLKNDQLEQIKKADLEIKNWYQKRMSEL